MSDNQERQPLEIRKDESGVTVGGIPIDELDHIGLDPIDYIESRLPVNLLVEEAIPAGKYLIQLPGGLSHQQVLQVIAEFHRAVEQAQ